MVRLHPLLEEFIMATLACTIVGTTVAIVFRLVTGLSPWPGLILGEIAGFGFGIAALTLASPRRPS